jgi:hypothetical protein
MRSFLEKVCFQKEFPYNICDSRFSVQASRLVQYSKVVVYVYTPLSFSVISLFSNQSAAYLGPPLKLKQSKHRRDFSFPLQYNGIPLHFSHSPFFIPIEKQNM